MRSSVQSGAVRGADTFRSPVIRNTLGEEAGRLVADAALERG